MNNNTIFETIQDIKHYLEERHDILTSTRHQLEKYVRESEHNYRSYLTTQNQCLEELKKGVSVNA
jgi:hypothetical protein